MRIWFDTEFIDDGKTIDLISIGMVRSDGKTLYRVSSEFDESKANEFVKDHVLPKLADSMRSPRNIIAQDVRAFCGTSPEFWAYYAAYDWVALCQLFGPMLHIPKDWPMYCRDLKQEIDRTHFRGYTVVSPNEHHALEDARWVKDTWERLMRVPQPVEA